MLSNKKIVCPNNLIDTAKKSGIVNAAIVNAGEIFPMESVYKAVEHNLVWTKKIYSVLKEKNIETNMPTANFFLMNFDKAKISSEQAFTKLTNKRLILRKMDQYKIPNSLRLTIGDKKENEYFIKAIKEILN